MTIEIGSVVPLSSGRPLMTVEELDEHSDARGSWFVNQMVQREWFALIAMQPQDVSKLGLSCVARGVVK